ncbi:MAG TPA: calcium/proton exchanger [Pantanalinema sp.]
MKYLYLLLVFIPVSVLAELLHWDPTVVFVTSCLAIVPLAKLMGYATEEIAIKAGPGIGGLLNATFGNAVELIIAVIALQKGLLMVVQASITGSILGNLLLVLGLSVLLGGLKHKEQRFNRTIAGANGAMLMLAVSSLLIPAAFVYTSPVTLATPGVQNLSHWVAILLLVVYGLSLVFSLKTHSHLYDGSSHGEGVEEPTLSQPKAIALLLGATALVAIESEFLVGSIEAVTHKWGLSELFIGVILIPLIGNAAEHLTAVTVAMKNKMDLSLGIAVGSSLQIALLVAPILVLVGWAIGQPLTLHFNLFEVVAIGIAVAIANMIAQDGESNWFEGAQLLAAYAILAIAFFFHP